MKKTYIVETDAELAEGQHITVSFESEDFLYTMSAEVVVELADEDALAANASFIAGYTERTLSAFEALTPEERERLKKLLDLDNPKQ